MKAPEKLYVDSTDNPNDVWIRAFREPFKKCGIEYIRTDAFIEKACEKLKKCMYDNLMFQGRLHRKEVIDNFVEDFQKYIKGE